METSQERLQRLKTQDKIEPNDLQWLMELAQNAERYENILSAIANIDALFYGPDGEDRPWDDKEALTKIEEMVTPVWNEVCARHRKERIDLTK